MDWKEACEFPVVRIEGIEVPKLLIGSSPFIGAGQFGDRSVSYYQKFRDPENIAKLLVAAADLGLPAVHIIPTENVVQGVKIAEKETGITFYKLGSTLPDAASSITELQQLSTEIIFIHGSVTDRMYLKTLQNLEEQILANEMIPGLAIHNTLPVLTWLKTHRKRLYSTNLLVPLNSAGVFVGNLKQALELLTELRMNVFAMKILAAGILPPEEAFQFVFKTNLVQVVTIGVASESEVQHSLMVVKNLLNE